METFDLMKQRHSVRQYKDISLDANQKRKLDQLIKQINDEFELHIQIFYDEPQCFNSAMAHYGKFSGVKNYVALVGKKDSQLDEKLGYCGEKIVIKMQEMGLNSCWVALTHGKSKADIGKKEKQSCLVAFGFGETQGTPHKSKSRQEVCNYKENMPEWFLRGVDAALLAPTAMNQQKFFFELCSDGKIMSTCGKGFYAKLDFGIVKYHFETISGKKL